MGCGATFTHVKSLNIHHLVKHKTVKYNYRDCRKTFSTPSSFHYYMLLHKDSRYACNHCDKKFVYPYGLKLHKNLHSRSRSYVCFDAECSHRYKWPQDLLCHTKIHLKEKHYQCRICKYSTYEGHLYHRHVILHTTRMLYPCLKCAHPFKHAMQCYCHERECSLKMKT